MWNHIVHRYDETDHEIVYDHVVSEFPILRRRPAFYSRIHVSPSR